MMWSWGSSVAKYSKAILMFIVVASQNFALNDAINRQSTEKSWENFHCNFWDLNKHLFQNITIINP